MFKIFSTYICCINKQNVTLEVSGAVRPLLLTLGVKSLNEMLSQQISVTPIEILVSLQLFDGACTQVSKWDN